MSETTASGTTASGTTVSGTTVNAVSTDATLLQVDGLVTHFPVPRGIVGTLRRAPRQVVRAVDGVSFSVDRGEMLAIVGESGSGKTTAIQTVLRMADPVAGSIRFAGEDITELGSRGLK
ncbi:ATP-binding cassette domain-containing protein, partial [Phytoactinopolyspora endophytica]|uniref:ATP-binding cassette domain-containing protein n=1 Tax=Phytoactinopolyspora endophytica TaxID=1642495 RepID=UPI00101E14D2